MYGGRYNRSYLDVERTVDVQGMPINYKLGQYRKTKLDRGAQPYVDDLYHLHISRIREIFMTIAGVLRRIRSQSMKFEEEEIRQKIFEELNNVRLAPENLIDEIEKTQISKLPLS